MTFKVIRGQGQGQDLSLPPYFQPIKKIPTVSGTRPKYLISRVTFFNFLLVIESVSSNQTLPKNRQNFLSSDLNEAWYDVRGQWDIHDDMTFRVIRGQGQGQEMTSVLCWDYLIIIKQAKATLNLQSWTSTHFRHSGVIHSLLPLPSPAFPSFVSGGSGMPWGVIVERRGGGVFPLPHMRRGLPEYF